MGFVPKPVRLIHDDLSWIKIFSDLATLWASDLRGFAPSASTLAKPPLAAAKPLLPCLVAGDVVGALRGA